LPCSGGIDLKVVSDATMTIEVTAILILMEISGLVHYSVRRVLLLIQSVCGVRDEAVG
jgi:hypothetical protein